MPVPLNVERGLKNLHGSSPTLGRGGGENAGMSTPDPEVLAVLQAAFEAVRAGDTVKLRDLLDMGVPPGLRNEKGDSLVMLASYHGFLEVTKLLLERGADPEVFNDMGQTPLQGAAFKGNMDMVKLLLEHGASVEGRGPNGRTALMMAAMFDRPDILKLLLERGADPHASDAAGMNALAAARQMGASSTVTLLENLKAGG